MDELTEAVSKKKPRKFKPTVSVGVSVDTVDRPSYPGAPKTDWREEEKKRLSAEIGALEKELKGFDPAKAAEKMRKALEVKLRLKKLRLEECQLKLDGGMDY